MEFLLSEYQDKEDIINPITEILIFSITANAFVATFIGPVLQNNYDSSIIYNFPTSFETIPQFTADITLIYFYQAAVLFLLYIFIKLLDIYYRSILKNKIFSNLLLLLLLSNLFAMFIVVVTVVRNYQPLSNKFLIGILSYSQLINYTIPIYSLRLLFIFVFLYMMGAITTTIINVLKNQYTFFVNIKKCLNNIAQTETEKRAGKNCYVKGISIVIITISFIILGITVPFSSPNNHETGSISITSSPSNASIYLDGMYQGKTPKLVNSVEQGSHLISMKLAGHENMSQAISVVADKTVIISPILTPSPTLVVTPTPLTTPEVTPTLISTTVEANTSTQTTVSPTETITESNWSGTWDTNYGILELRQSGSKVEGNYSYDKEGYGNIQGYIQGDVSGDKLLGTWHQAPTYNPPDYAGAIEFTMTNDHKSFSGKWRLGSEEDWSGSWGGTRVNV